MSGAESWTEGGLSALRGWLDTMIRDAEGQRHEIEEDFSGGKRPNDADLAYAREKAYREVRELLPDNSGRRRLTAREIAGVLTPEWTDPRDAEREEGAAEANDRCASCEHRRTHHSSTGECWYSVTSSRADTAIGCSCREFIPGGHS